MIRQHLAEVKELIKVFKPYSSDEMDVYIVSNAVNITSNNFKELIKQLN